MRLFVIPPVIPVSTSAREKGAGLLLTCFGVLGAVWATGCGVFVTAGAAARQFASSADINP